MLPSSNRQLGPHLPSRCLLFLCLYVQLPTVLQVNDPNRLTLPVQALQCMWSAVWRGLLSGTHGAPPFESSHALFDDTAHGSSSPTTEQYYYHSGPAATRPVPAPEAWVVDYGVVPTDLDCRLQARHGSPRDPGAADAAGNRRARIVHVHPRSSDEVLKWTLHASTEHLRSICNTGCPILVRMYVLTCNAVW